MKKLFLILFITVSVFGQVKMDPRALGLAGAYSTLSRGIFSVGWNPANLAFNEETSTMISLGNVYLKMNNSSFSMTNLNKFSGQDLESIDAYTGEPYKVEFMELFPDEGLNIYSQMDISIPLMNISRNNMAYTSDLAVFSDITLPKAFVNILLSGNEINKEYDITLGLETMAVLAHRFSLALPNSYGAFGFTVSYLQGLSYMGIDPEVSSAYFITDTSVVDAHGEFITRKTIGGNGVGLDIGFTSNEFNGWQVGLAINNLFSNITWNKPTYTYDILTNLGLTSGDRAQYRKYWFGIDELYPTDFLPTGSSDSTSTSGSIVDDKFYSGDSSITAADESFSVKYPAVFRIGVLRRLNDEVTLVMDMSTGFDDRFFARTAWILSTGLEIVRSPVFPIRVGLAVGGDNYKMMSFGFSLRKSIFSLDFGAAFDSGFTVETARGIELSLGGHIRL